MGALASVSRYTYDHVEQGPFHSHLQDGERKTKNRLYAHKTVYNACANELKSQGIELKCGAAQGTNGGAEWVTWMGISDTHHLGAANPVELLGLAELVRRRGSPEKRSYWWRRDSDEDIAWYEITEGLRAAGISLEDLKDPS